MTTLSPSTSTSAAARKRPLALFGLSLGYFMVLLDTTIVTVALPAIHTDMGGPFTSLEWVVNAYTVLFASLLLSMGALSDRYGAKRIFGGGLVLFGAASALSSAAPTLGALIVLRGILGIGGAAMTSASLTLISSLYEDPRERTKALGVFAAVSGIALAAGPVLGGLLSDGVGWRSIFIVNIPIAVLSLILLVSHARETDRNKERSLDLAGQLTATLFFLALTFALVEAGSLGWSSPFVTSAAGIAAVSLFLFAVVEARGKSPMLPVQLLRERRISAGLAAGLAVNFGLSGCLFVLTFFFQQVLGYSALLTGLAFLPLTLPMMVNPMLTSRIVNRVGVRLPLIGGFFVSAVGTALLVVASRASYWLLFVGLFLIGYGLSLTIPSLVTTVVTSSPPGQAGVVSGSLNAIRQLGAALGVAVLSLYSNGGAGAETAAATSASGVTAALLVSTFVLVGGGVMALLFIGRQPEKKQA
ncbi:MFS transporter [Paenibacillus flagellatus]|uniref:MFS transporter n=1 Tax=Paenibacillus flagellatus TaxID=2211139 RepID=A0A2V5KEP9_9BACL|nr:MFS transporter [Paenibacillus flagellatus]PYI52460.1 MFS transporter [Paenibacillus flagellatus]